MKIQIRMIGRTREKWWKAAEEEYHKRLKPFLDIELKELKAESLDNRQSPMVNMEREALRLLSGLKAGDLVVALDSTGKEFSSDKLALNFSQWLEQGRSKLVFLIGGADGLDPSVLQRAELVLSLSRMTFTHQMARVFLLEQIYRCWMIRSGRSYHR